MKQIDGIETLGIAQDIVSFMRTVPLHAQGSHDGAPAHYDRATGIDFRVDALDLKKPVLLHELLRAFQEQKFKAPTTRSSRARITRRARRAPGRRAAPMLKSPQDYFRRDRYGLPVRRHRYGAFLTRAACMRRSPSTGSGSGACSTAFTAAKAFSSLQRQHALPASFQP